MNATLTPVAVLLALTLGTVACAPAPPSPYGGANADTPYAITTVDLKAAGPMVVELPPGPFIGFVNDHNMRWGAP